MTSKAPDCQIGGHLAVMESRNVESEMKAPVHELIAKLRNAALGSEPGLPRKPDRQVVTAVVEQSRIESRQRLDRALALTKCRREIRRRMLAEQTAKERVI